MFDTMCSMYSLFNIMSHSKTCRCKCNVFVYVLKDENFNEVQKSPHTPISQEHTHTRLQLFALLMSFLLPK